MGHEKADLSLSIVVIVLVLSVALMICFFFGQQKRMKTLEARVAELEPGARRAPEIHIDNATVIATPKEVAIIDQKRSEGK